MKDSVVSNCQKEFLLRAIRSGKRLDGRGFEDFRNLDINFGTDYGCCYVTLGETKVVAQVSCDLNEPRPMRPNEGLLYINVDISETVCPSFDTGQKQHLTVRANRLLEKCIKESQCVDLEALCITAAEQVWDLRVDVTVLNYDGNLVSCCSVACLAALAHFRTPAVTLEQSELVIHPIKDREPVPLSLHHFPILITFVIFSDGGYTVADPTELEEKVSEAELVIGMNNYREVCGLHFSGKAIGNKELILGCSSKAALLAASLVARVKQALETDRDARAAPLPGLSEVIHLERILSASKDRQALRLRPEEVAQVLGRRLRPQHLKFGEEDDNEDEEMDQEGEIEEATVERPTSSASYLKEDRKGGVLVDALKAPSFGREWIPSGGDSLWENPGSSRQEGEEVEEESSDDDVNFVRAITEEDRIIDRIELSGDSEEEDVIILEGHDE